jgi:hypothetical protein
MGSRPAPAPVTYIPEPVAPTVFQSVVPEEDFARATQYIQELKTERETAKAERYAEIGTPEEIRARMDKRSKVTEAAYESSLPKPEIDYTAGLDPARLNNLNTFLSKLVERRQGKGKAPAPAPAAAPAPKVDTAKAVRQAVQAPAPKPAPRPVPAPAPRPAPRPAPAPAPRPAPKPAPAPAPAKYYGPTEFSFKEDGPKPSWYRGGGGKPFEAPPGYIWTRSSSKDGSDDPSTTINYRLREKTKFD